MFLKLVVIILEKELILSHTHTQAWLTAFFKYCFVKILVTDNLPICVVSYMQCNCHISQYFLLLEYTSEMVNMNYIICMYYTNYY